MAQSASERMARGATGSKRGKSSKRIDKEPVPGNEGMETKDGMFVVRAYVSVEADADARKRGATFRPYDRDDDSMPVVKGLSIAAGSKYDETWSRFSPVYVPHETREAFLGTDHPILAAYECTCDSVWKRCKAGLKARASK